jgi:hypothetical protein
MFLSPLRADTKTGASIALSPTNQTIKTMYIITLKAQRGRRAASADETGSPSVRGQARELETVASPTRSMITRSSNTAPMSSELSKHFGESAATAAHSGVVIAER